MVPNSWQEELGRVHRLQFRLGKNWEGSVGSKFLAGGMGKGRTLRERSWLGWRRLRAFGSARGWGGEGSEASGAMAAVPARAGAGRLRYSFGMFTRGWRLIRTAGAAALTLATVGCGGASDWRVLGASRDTVLVDSATHQQGYVLNAPAGTWTRLPGGCRRATVIAARIQCQLGQNLVTFTPGKTDPRWVQFDEDERTVGQVAGDDVGIVLRNRSGELRAVLLDAKGKLSVLPLAGNGIPTVFSARGVPWLLRGPILSDASGSWELKVGQGARLFGGPRCGVLTGEGAIYLGACGAKPRPAWTFTGTVPGARADLQRMLDTTAVRRWIGKELVLISPDGDGLSTWWASAGQVRKDSTLPGRVVFSLVEWRGTALVATDSGLFWRDTTQWVRLPPPDPEPRPRSVCPGLVYSSFPTIDVRRKRSPAPP